MASGEDDTCSIIEAEVEQVSRVRMGDRFF